MNKKFFELPEEKRQRIINAGFEVFSKSEYKHASTDLIAAKAGISKGLLFYYFHNKRTLYMFLFECAEKLLRESVLGSHFYEITDIFELLEYSTATKYALLKKMPHILDFSMQMYRSQKEDITEDINRKWQDTSASLFTQFFANIDYSKFREDVDPREIIQMLLWMAEGYLDECQRFGATGGVDKLLEKFRSWALMFKKIAYKEEYLK